MQKVDFLKRQKLSADLLALFNLYFHLPASGDWCLRQILGMGYGLEVPA